MTTFYIVRHGESEGNANFDKKVIIETASEFGTPLTPLGREQAKKLGKKLQHIHFDAAFSSDLLRAKETAEIVTLERKIALKTKKAIRERSFSLYLSRFPNKTYDGLVKELRSDLDKLQDAEKMAYKHTQEMESAEEAVERLTKFLSEVAVAYIGKTVLVVNHGNNIRSLLVHLGYAMFDELPSSAVENTGYIVLESDGVNFVIKETVGIIKNKGENRGW